MAKPVLFDKFGNSIIHCIPNPSERFIDCSEILTAEKRKRLIDLAARHVDKNNFTPGGRASMCLQFAILIKYMLDKESVLSKVVQGQAEYNYETNSFCWAHSWIETESGEIIDCNIDSIIYHPDTPDGLEPYNFWGPIQFMPTDRRFFNKKVLTDDDIIKIEQGDNETVVWKNIIDGEY